MTPEDRDGFEDHDGCPDANNDGDALPDAQDRCPDAPETMNGVSDEDGCPDESSVKVAGDRIELTEMIMFEPDKAVIVGASLQVVDHMAGLLKAHPHIARVRVEGHTDAMGPPAYNLDLSQRRADAVVAALVTRGIEASRLEARGFGATRIICRKLTPDCHARNRRTEFHIVPPAESGPSSGSAPGSSGPTSGSAPGSSGPAPSGLSAPQPEAPAVPAAAPSPDPGAAPGPTP